MPRIPNIFHFVFGLKPQREPFHLAFYLCIESCLRTNRPDAIYLYYHHEPYGRYWELTRERVTLIRVQPDQLVLGHRYADQGINPYRYAHHADFIRLERLLETGGIYADMDTLFVRAIPEHLRDHPFVLGSEGEVLPEAGTEPVPSLCNALIMAEPGAEFGRHWLSAMPAAFGHSWSSHSTLLPWRLSQQYPDLIHIEPQRSFYRHSFTPEGIHALFEELDEDLDGVHSFHLWSHLWWARRRRDFSNFHAGRLTEAYVARGNTTYARIAQPYLPPPTTLLERMRLSGSEALETLRRRLLK